MRGGGKSHKLLYFYTAPSSFVEKDLAIFSSNYRVRTFLFPMTRKGSWPLLFIRQKLFLLRHIFSTQLVVCQFAGMHGVLPIFFARICRRRSVVVAGGTDCVGFPSIRYGNFASATNARFTRYCYSNCSLILPVHQTLVDYQYTYTSADHPRQGILYFMPLLKTPIKVIHNGYDAALWNRNGIAKETQSFITVLAYSNSRFTTLLKGIDLFLALAKAMPEAKFTVVGPMSEDISVPGNVKRVSNLRPAELARLVASQQFYVQLSVSEGFPNALSEAMLCECVPVVSAVGGMPDIVGDCGFVLPVRDERVLIEGVRVLLQSADLGQKGQRAREKIRNNYPLEKRKQELLQTLSELTND